LPGLADQRDLPILAFSSEAKWAAWLKKNHENSSGLWLKIAKKGSGLPSVSYDEALNVALRYGWIDGQKGKFDDDYWVQRFTPRRSRSKWSKINRTKATALIEAGQMEPAGLREVERAQADGRWDAAYEGQRTASVPPDLQQELDSNETARRFFESLSGVNRYAILYRIQDAKRPETRRRRIEKYIQMLSEGKTIHP
jgi:uncharacterized protein YdeI (YjbR/CyaY-like superfamily)